LRSLYASLKRKFKYQESIDTEKENAKRDWEGWVHHGHHGHGDNNGHHGGDSGWLQGPDETF